MINPTRPRMDTNRKSEYTTVEEEMAAHEEAVGAQLAQWEKHLPALLKKFARIPDPRRPGSVRHSVTVLLMYGLLLFVFHYASRREANREMTGPTLATMLRTVFPSVDSTPHFDTVERLLRTIPVETLEEFLEDRVTTILNKHHIRAYLADHGWVVAIDGTQKTVRNHRFAKELLSQKVSGTTDTYRYRVYVLESVLIADDGLTLPLPTEFCENIPDADPKSKQDCELKAFRRLAARLKQWFPLRRLLLVMDGLYPNGPVFDLCRSQGWDFMIVLPAQCLPSVWEEFLALRAVDTDGTSRREHQWGNRFQVFTWVNGIAYSYQDGKGKRHTLAVHVVQCEETWTDAQGKRQRRVWAWLSERPLTVDNVVARCNRGARHRWDIESTFLVQKRHGGHYEHAFSYDWQAMKGWHSLMKLAHLLNVLTLWSAVGRRLMRRYGYEGTVKFLRQTWTNPWLRVEFLQTWAIRMVLDG